MIFAKWKRFWHCLFNLHCSIDIFTSQETIITCSCGKVFNKINPKNLMGYEMIQLVAENYDEIMKVWEELGGKGTIAEAAIEWNKRRK